jgi:hypothetical protein
MIWSNAHEIEDSVVVDIVVKRFLQPRSHDTKLIEFYLVNLAY